MCSGRKQQQRDSAADNTKCGGSLNGCPQQRQPASVSACPLPIAYVSPVAIPPLSTNGGMQQQTPRLGPAKNSEKMLLGMAAAGESGGIHLLLQHSPSTFLAVQSNPFQPGTTTSHQCQAGWQDQTLMDNINISRGSQMRAMATTNSLTILPFCFFFFLLSIGLSVGQVQQQWDPSNYPNPTASDWKRCNMRSRALLCDPDAVLSEQERYRVNYELQQLESSTRQEQGREFCERKGISAAVALARKVRGGNQDAVRAMANDMLRRWNIDAQCQKAIVVVLSVEDRSFWVARMPQVPVYGTELNELFKAERENFRSGRYAEGVQNVLRAIQEKALSKQQRQPVPPDDGRSKGPPFVPPRPGKQRPEPSGGGGIGGFKWLMILGVLFLVVLPLLCCCCCIYFCFFRKKGDSGAGGGHPGGYGTQDPEGGGGPRAGGRGGGFGGLPLVGALSGIGGAATNFFNKRRGGGGTAGGGGVAGGGGQAPPPYYDPVPQDDRRGQQPGAGGKSTGLYPNVPVKDEGGGGSW